MTILVQHVSTHVEAALNITTQFVPNNVKKIIKINIT